MLFVPLRGVSAIATEGQPFHDPDADEALFSTLREDLDDQVEVHELDADVNDPAFALAMANRLHELIGRARMTRQRGLARLRGEIDAGRPVIGAGAGTGLSAKCAEAGGADLIIIYNSGRYRMAGRGSLSGLLPYGDANAIVVDMAREVLPIVEHAGARGRLRHGSVPADGRLPRRAQPDRVQRRPELPDRRPLDGTIRQSLEETGMGYGLEVDMIRLARERTCSRRRTSSR